jgi:lipoprotein-anchoring transpeptidase ErfK/SrfK
VDKSDNTLTLATDKEIIKVYKVGTGKEDVTPAGTFTIETKLIDPVWYKTGGAIPYGSPENILGSRWLGLNLPQYGIHGGAKEDELGRQVSAGCVRMLNKDVEELFDIVPRGTEVVIVD